MRKSLRHSPPARVVAFCFILVVILGNIWITYAVVGKEPPAWVHTAFPLVGIATLAAGLWLGAWSLMHSKVEDESE